MAVDKFVLDQSELFALAQRFESLAKQNAQKARRIADLEAELARAQATKHEPIRPIIEFVKDENYEAPPEDKLGPAGHYSQVNMLKIWLVTAPLRL